MSTDLFDDPAPAVTGDYFKPTENVGSLILFEPTEMGTDTFRGGPEKPAVFGKAHNIDNGRSFALKTTATGIVGQLKSKLGKQVVGRLVKDGQTIVIQKATDEDKKKAAAFVESKSKPAQDEKPPF
jgi:hypothetical protein